MAGPTPTLTSGVDRSLVSRATRLPRAFYRRPTLDVARDLLGKVLVHTTTAGVVTGVIVEVEAYIGEDDPACHAAPGLTRRNLPLYGPPGHAYVYLNYGMHYLLNAVTEPVGYPAAVLIRALQPRTGRPLMRRRRKAPAVDALLCRGPGNVTRALGVTLRHNRTDLCGDRLYIEDPGRAVGAIGWSPRIGIRVGTDRRWRAYLRDSDAVSASPV